MIWDMELTILDWNESAVNLFGYSEDDVKGKTLYDTLLRGLVDAEEVIHAIHAQVESSSGGFQNINQNKKKDGTIITCDWYNSPVFDDEGKPLYLISEAIDISQDQKRNKMKDELAPYIRRKSEELEQNMSRFEDLLGEVNEKLIGTANSITENRKDTETLAMQFNEIGEILQTLEDIVNISHINQINLRIQASRLQDIKSGNAFKVIGTQFDAANTKIESLIQQLSVFYQKIEHHLNGMNENFSYLLKETEHQKMHTGEVRSQYHSIQEYLTDFHLKVDEYLQL